MNPSHLSLSRLQMLSEMINIVALQGESPSQASMDVTETEMERKTTTTTTMKRNENTSEEIDY